MQIKLETTPVEQLSVDALAVICFESDENPPQILASQNSWLPEMLSSGEFSGKLYELAILHRPQGVAAKRLAVMGGGKRAAFSAVEARRIAGSLMRSLKPKGVHSLGLLLPQVDAPTVCAVAEGAVLGGWEADKYKSDPKKNEKRIDTFALCLPTEAVTPDLEAAFERGRIIGEAQNQTRDLVNEPANKLTPADLVAAARAMASSYGLECEVLDTDAMTKLGMGALLGVAQGSSNPPFLIVLKYRSPQPSGSSDHLALVGKGVTFDTGGLSIKPADGMERMKYDMAGAAAVIGAMRALAQLKPGIPVTGYIPTVENMINGNAQRPGDIVTALSGKTIEVLNTDAEGRLILADALTYATRNGATHIVDAATLTGAIGIALGHHNMGAFTNNEAFLAKFMAAALVAGEKAWQLPMDEEYKDYLKSAFADLPNIGGRHGGSITAAWFLREFADPTPWVHLDIASTAWLDEGKGWLSKGPSGVGVRSFVQLALDWARG